MVNFPDEFKDRADGITHDESKLTLDLLNVYVADVFLPYKKNVHKF